MARPAKARSPEATDKVAKANVNHEALEAAGQAAAIQGQQIALIDAQFGVGMVYQKEMFVARIQHLTSDVGLKSLEIGLLLIQIRARESSGDFLAVLDTIGVSTRFAQRAMQVARKFGGSEHRQQLAKRLGMSKVLALLAEDDEDIDELAEGGELAGYKADEFDRMTKADVIKALKSERDDRADEKSADEEIIRKKDERINKLSRRSTRSGVRDQVGELLADLDRFTVEANTNMKQIRDTVGAINTLYDEAKEQPEEEVTERIETNLRTSIEWANQLSSEIGE